MGGVGEPGALGPKKPFAPPQASTPGTTYKQAHASFQAFCQTTLAALPPREYSVRVNNQGVVTNIQGMPDGEAKDTLIAQLNAKLTTIQSDLAKRGGQSKITSEDFPVTVAEQ